ASAETVTVSYTKPTSGAVVQDAAGNDAADFSAKPVTNTTPAPSDTTAPEFSNAAVNGNELVLTYTEADTLDPAALAGNAGFTVSSTTGTAITVNSAVVNATAKTVTLTLSRAVASAETVTVSYTKPTSGAVVQDAAGNDAADFSAKPVTNTTPAPADTTAPEFRSAAVNGNELVLTYTEANTLDPAALAGNAGFTVSSTTGTAITVNSAVVNATAKTVTLTLSRAVASAETVTVSYTKPTSGAVVQDAAGNDAADFSTKPVTNTTPAPADNTAPEFSRAAVNGNELVLTYTEAGTLDPAALAGNAGFTVSSTGTAITVNSAVVNATAKTVTLTLSRAVTSAETVTVSYTKPTSGAVVQDAAGNDAADFSARAVTNDTPAPSDTTPPEFSSATIDKNQLVITYTEAGTLDPAALAGNAGFAVSSSTGTAITVNSAVVNATAKTVTLTLSRTVTSAETTVTVSYTKPTSGAVVQDAAGNDAADFSAKPVTNSTPAPVAPAPAPAAPAAPPSSGGSSGGGSPAPAPGPHREPDTDSDGVPDAQENQAIGPTGAARGDGNRDDVQDRTQAAVASYSATTSSSSSTSVTLVADSQEGKVNASSTVRITSLVQKAVPTSMSRALETPIALTSFKATLDATGSSETFSLYVDPKLGANGYWAQDSSGTWVNLASSPYGGKMVNEGGRLRLDFAIQDGGQFDADDKADGTITASGAAAQMPLSITGQASDVLSGGGFWF
ncbi:SwmB domain-containing protein, partial [Verminephrobacter aporrectodeae]|uniref:SwmB domain-containing protein n=2 Tax=Verminephrobacter aporrectodeae TaxID=1110389 RepID=UPI002244D456